MFDLKSDMEPMHRMKREDFFIQRLKLLMVMCRAFINGYPVGDYRKESILNNAKQVFFEVADWGGEYINVRDKNSMVMGVELDHYFYQRVKLLALMVKSFAEGNPMGSFRKKAVEETLDEIEKKLKINNPKIEDIPIFNVA